MKASALMRSACPGEHDSRRADMYILPRVILINYFTRALVSSDSSTFRASERAKSTDLYTIIVHILIFLLGQESRVSDRNTPPALYRPRVKAHTGGPNAGLFRS